MKKRKSTKRISVFMLLMFLLVTTLAACETENTIVSSEDTVTEANSGENILESEEAVSEEIEISDAISAVEVSLRRENFYDYEDMMFAQGGYDQILLGEHVSPNLLKSISEWNQSRGNAMKDEFENIKVCARTDYEDNPEYFFGPYENYANLYIKRADSKVLSVEEDLYFFSGGVHGTSAYGGYTWDVNTGKLLSLEDIITDTESLPEILAEKFEQKYPDIQVFADTTQEVFAEYLKPDRSFDFTWTLEYDGIVFYFGHYELAAYVDGLQQLKILFAEAPELFNENYFAEDSQKFITQFEPDQGIDFDADGDNITENVSVICYGEGQDTPCNYYSIDFGGVVLDCESYFYKVVTYLVKSNGNNYLYVETYHDNDHRNFNVYSLKNGAVEQVACWSGGLNHFTNPDGFTLQTTADVLGTHLVERECAIGEDGCPVYLEADYKVFGGSVVTKKDFEVEELDANGNAIGFVICPAGTEMFFDRTDCATYMTFKLEDGRRCYVSVMPEWPPTVNGYPADECFEELFHAG